MMMILFCKQLFFNDHAKYEQNRSFSENFVKISQQIFNNMFILM